MVGNYWNITRRQRTLKTILPTIVVELNSVRTKSRIITIPLTGGCHQPFYGGHVDVKFKNAFNKTKEKVISYLGEGE